MEFMSQTESCSERAAEGPPPRVTPEDRAHFERIARYCREEEAEEIRRAAARTPGENLLRALKLSGELLGDRPAPPRPDDQPEMFYARWRALEAGRTTPVPR